MRRVGVCPSVRPSVCPIDRQPVSGVVADIDVTLRCGWLCDCQVKKAFFALVDNGVRAAPLWDTATQNVVGGYFHAC